MKKIFFVSILLFSFSFGFSNSNNAEWNNCPPPSNIIVTSQTATSVSFDWDDCGCAVTEYRVYFEKDGLNSQEYSASSSDISFAGLSAGSYRFYFYTACGGTVSSIIIDDVVMG